MPERTVYPFIPEKHWWALRAQFQKSLPTAVTPTYLQSLLGLNSIRSAKNLISPLKQLGLIDAEGKPTARANDWRTDAKYDEVCAQIVKEVYPQELRDLFSGPDLDRDGCMNWFMHSAMLGRQSAQKCVATYVLLNTPLALARNVRSKDRTVKAKKSSSSRRRSRTDQGTTSSNGEVHFNRSVEAKPHDIVDMDKYPSLHIDLQIHISPEADAAQIDQIFASIAKYLYRKT